MAEYTRNRVLFSALGERFYFVPKARLLDGGIMRVVGKKIDVTEDVKRFIDVATASPARKKGRVRRG